MSIRYDDKFVKTPQMEIEYTPEMVSDLVKCSEDILYFLNFVTIVTIDGGRKKLGDLLYPFQKEMIKMCKDNRYLCFLFCRQSGKCVSYDTKIKIRDKRSRTIEEVIIGDFYKKCNFSTVVLDNDDKFIEIKHFMEYEVFTPSGWKQFRGIGKTKKFPEYEITLENKIKLNCADTHIVYKDNKEIFVKDLKNKDFIQTEDGLKEVSNVRYLGNWVEMYDCLDVDGSIYYTNGIKSHNSTTVGAFALWYAIFNSDKFIGIASNKASSAKDLLRRIKIMYEELPFYLKPGVVEYNKNSIEFENGSKIETAGTTEDTFRGRTCVPDYTKICICDDIDNIYYTTISKANSSNINNYMEGHALNIKYTKKYYYVYKTTNLINKKIYIGFHSTNDLEDGYLGSGKALKRAIEKYGPENFEKEIIEIFDNREDAETLERLLVNKDFVKEKDNYNLSLGGNVCILFGEQNGFYGKTHSEEFKKRNSKRSKLYKHKPKTKEKISKSNKKLWADPEFKEKMIKIFKNRPPMSGETRQKLSMSLKGRKFSEEHRKNLSISQTNRFKTMTEEEYKEWYEKTFTKERNEKLSNSLKGHKKSEEWINKINKNPEKIRKTAEKHRGMKRSEATCKRISESRKNKPANNKDKIHIYNPKTLESKQITKNEVIPEGWERGTGKKKETRKNTIWIHNIKSGEIKMHSEFLEIPEGWVRGRK